MGDVTYLDKMIEGPPGPAGPTGPAGPAGPSGSEISVATVAALAAVDATGLADGTPASVAGIGGYFLNASPSASSDGVNVITATNGEGAAWERVVAPSAGNIELDTLYVNTGTGSDGSRDPSNSGTPLASLNEAFRRIAVQTLGNAITIHYTGSGSDLSCDLSGILPSSGNPTTITVIGDDVTVGAAQSVSSVTAPSPSTNTRGTVVVSGSTTFNGMFKNNEGSGSDAVSWVYNNDGSHTYSMTDAIDLTPAIRATQSSDSIFPMTLNSAIQNITVKGLPYGYALVIQQCAITGQITNQASAMQVQFKQCKVSAQQTKLQAGYFENCSTAGFAMLPGSDVRVFAGIVGTNSTTVPAGATLTFGGSLTNEGSRLLIAGGRVAWNVFLSRADLNVCFFSSVTDCVEVSQGGELALTSCTVWGANNSVSNILNIVDSGYVRYTSTALPTISGSWALGARSSSAFSEWPVAAEKMDAGYLLLDPTSGQPGASKYLTAQTTNIGATNLFGTNPRKGLYRFAAYVSINTAGTSGAVTLNAIFTDDSGVSRTVAVATSGSIASTGGIGGSIDIETNGSSQVQYSVTGITTAGSLSYSARITVTPVSDG